MGWEVEKSLPCNEHSTYSCENWKVNQLMVGKGKIQMFEIHDFNFFLIKDISFV